MSKVKAELQVKLIIVGDSGVGKTCFARVFENRLLNLDRRQSVTASSLYFLSLSNYIRLGLCQKNYHA